MILLLIREQATGQPSSPQAQYGGTDKQTDSYTGGTSGVRGTGAGEWRDPNIVKLVADAGGNALYFSRAPIPAVRDGGDPGPRGRRHVGLYAYRAGALKRWNTLPASPLAELESLEQLRALAAGWRIVVAEGVEAMPPGVDTPEDLDAVRAQFRADRPGVEHPS